MALQTSSFGALLKRYRLAAGLTQEALAERASLSARAVSDLERGLKQTPRRDTVALLTQALGLEPPERAALEETVPRRRGPPTPLAHSVETPAMPSLPVPLTPLIGREHEVAAVAHLFHAEGARLLTLTGPGGVGKTRLALAVAATVREQYADGVIFIDLVPLRAAALVALALARALGLRASPAQALRESIMTCLRPKQILLVLDNVEHVATATPFLMEVLTACPRVVLLLTSRAALRVRGEQQFSVPPLATPDPARLPSLETLAHVPAVTLFLQRARAVKPSFALTDANAGAVAALCQRLDGLPLAIELAAARSGVLPPQALLARLGQRLDVLTEGPRDLPALQRTLRDAIAWSYDLLPADAQAIFRRLSVFVGGCTLHAAEEVCDTSKGRRARILDGVGVLVEQSLLRSEEGIEGDGRLGMLETLREYAQERLAASGEEEATRRAHVAYYLVLAETAEPELKGAEQATWLKLLDEEHDNLRAALTWTLDTGMAAEALRLATALCAFWGARGHLSEGCQWLQSALDHGTAAPPTIRARALLRAGALAYLQSDYAQAAALLNDSRELAEALQDTGIIAHSCNGLGLAAMEQGDFARAMSYFARGATLMRAAGDIRGAAQVLNNMGNTTLYRGDYARASTLFEESLALFRRVNDPASVALALANLGNVLLHQGDYARAAGVEEESLALWREMGDKRGTALALTLLGAAVLRWGDHARATSLLEESLALRRAMGDKDGIAVTLHALGVAALLRGDQTRARVLQKESLTLCQQVGDKMTACDALDELAQAAARGAAERAARLWGAVEGLRAALSHPLPPIEEAAHARYVVMARAHLAKERFAAAWAEGQVMSLEQAIADALNDDLPPAE